MKHRLAILALALAAAAALPSITVPAFADDTRVGMLTCLADAPPSDPNGTWQMSCTFEAATSKNAQRYDGTILGMVPSARREGKALMLWAVLATTNEIKVAEMVGSYRIDPERPSTMIGETSRIVLQPLAPTEQGANIAASLKMIRLSLPKA